MNIFKNSPRFIALILFLALVPVVSLCDDSIRNITILHHNDFHAANLPHLEKRSNKDSTIVMGAAGLKGLAQAVRDSSSPSLWLFAGDEYTGTPISSMSEGSSQIQICRRLGFDIAVLGNHEFDYGLERAEAFRDSIGVPVLGGANVHYGDGTPFARVYIDTLLGGVKIRIVGIISENLKLLTSVEATGNLRIISADEALKQIIPPADRLFIVLSHMGFSADSALALRMPEIDLIVGGHQHRVLQRPLLIAASLKSDENLLTGDGKNRLPGPIIVQAGSKGRYLGVLSLTVKNGDVISASGRLLQNDGLLAPPDENLAGYVQSVEQEFTLTLDEQIAVLKDPLTRSKEEIESSLGRWVTDAYRNAAGADISFDNPGGLRKNLTEGSLKMRDIWEAVPFGNTLIIFEMTGTEIKKALEFSIRGSREKLLVSGVTAEISSRTGKAAKIMMGSKPLELESTYKIVVNSYIFGHFEKYFGFKQGERFSYDTELIDRMVLIERAKKEKVIHSPTDARILIIE